MAGDYCEPWCVAWLDESAFGLRGCHDCYVSNEDALERAVACVNALEGIPDPAALVQAARDAAENLYLAATIAREHGYVHSADSFVGHADRLRAALGEGEG